MNMPASTEDISSVFATYLTNNAIRPSSTNAIGFVPSYSMQGYMDAVAGWVSNFTDPTKQITWDLDIANSAGISWQSLNHSDSSTSSSRYFWIYSSGSSSSQLIASQHLENHTVSTGVSKFAGLGNFPPPQRRPMGHPRYPRRLSEPLNRPIRPLKLQQDQDHYHPRRLRRGFGRTL